MHPAGPTGLRARAAACALLLLGLITLAAAVPELDSKAEQGRQLIRAAGPSGLSFEAYVRGMGKLPLGRSLRELPDPEVSTLLRAWSRLHTKTPGVRKTGEGTTSTLFAGAPPPPPPPTATLRPPRRSAA